MSQHKAHTLVPDAPRGEAGSLGDGLVRIADGGLVGGGPLQAGLRPVGRGATAGQDE